MKRFFLMTWLVFVLAMLSINSGAERTMLYPAHDENEQWGYINEFGEWVISPQYDSAGNFYGHYAVVSRPTVDADEKVGSFCVINIHGEIILQDIKEIDCSEERYWIYGYQSDGEDDYLAVGCFDWRNGKKVELNPNAGYEFSREISNAGNIVPVFSPEQKLGFFDLQHEKLLFPPQFNPPFSDEASGVSSWNDVHVVCECGDDETENSPFTLLSSDGTMLSLPETIKFYHDENKLVIHAKDYFVNDNNGITCVTTDDHYVLLNHQLRPISGILRDYESCGKECIMITEDEKLYKYVNSDGTLLFEEEYLYVGDWIDGFASVIAKNGANMIIRKDGSCVKVLPVHCSGYDAGNHMTVYYEEDTLRSRFLFDRQSEKIKEINIDGFILCYTEKETGLFQSYETGLYGMINADGNVILKPIYQVDDEHKNFLFGMLAVAYEDKMGYLSDVGTVTIPFQYKEAHPFNGEIAMVITENDEVKYINHEGKTVYSFP